MPWVVGIDEAGYGPNLGPLVQAAVAVKLPDEDEAGWEALRPAVRRAGEKDDGRLLIDDSKRVYAGGTGLARLERGVLAPLGLPGPTFAEVLRKASLPWVHEELPREVWFDPTDPTPIVADPAAVQNDLTRLSGNWPGEAVSFGPACAAVVPTPRFNRAVAESGSKATVLTAGLVELMPAMVAGLPAGEPVLFLCDKQGGRNYYAPLLQQAFPGGWVIAEKESLGESRYRVMELGREVRVVFRPRADAESMSVALASMLCKYLREVCMRQFNRFWARHVPDLKPTAGYPGDAKRFFDAIRPAMEKLGIAEEAVWRCR